MSEGGSDRADVAGLTAELRAAAAELLSGDPALVQRAVDRLGARLAALSTRAGGTDDGSRRAAESLRVAASALLGAARRGQRGARDLLSLAVDGGGPSDPAPARRLPGRLLSGQA